MGNFVYLVHLLLFVWSYTTSGVEKTRKSKLVRLRTIGPKKILIGYPCIDWYMEVKACPCPVTYRIIKL